jgi:hypothetical protein
VAGVVDVAFAPVYFVELSEIVPRAPGTDGIVLLQVIVTSPVVPSILLVAKLEHDVAPVGKFNHCTLPAAIAPFEAIAPKTAAATAKNLFNRVISKSPYQAPRGRYWRLTGFCTFSMFRILQHFMETASYKTYFK